MRQALIISTFLLCGLAAHAEQLQRCDELVVRYSGPNLISMNDHVLVQRLKSRPDPVRKENDAEYKPFSPQQTAAFNRILVADTAKGGPYTNSVQVFTLKGKPVSWQINLTGVSDNVELQWLNEELLFIRAWWGRVVSTDLIFQLSTGKFIYAKEANYGQLTQPCDEAKMIGKVLSRRKSP